MNRKKREQIILDAATRVFARQGFSKTSVSEIIHEADVARGTFYLYFKNKKEVFNILLDRFLSELSHNVAKINALLAKPGDDLAQQFRLLSSDFISTVTKNRSLTKIILFNSRSFYSDLGGSPSGGSPFDDKMSQFYEQLFQIIRVNLEANIKTGLFRSCQTDVVTRSIIGSVKELISAWIIQDNLEVELNIQGLIDYLLNGLVPNIPFTADKAIPAEELKGFVRTDANLH